MFTCGILVVFLDKIGPSTPHRRPYIGNKKCKIETQCEPSNPNQVHLQWGVYQTKALNETVKIAFTISLGLEGKKNSASADEKHTF